MSYREFTLERVGLLLAVLATGSCSDPVSPTKPLGIYPLAGHPMSDTANALMSSALRVEVRDSSGRVATDAVVRFTSLVSSGVAEIRVAALTSQAYGSFVAVNTNGSGEAAVLLQLGARTPLGRLEVSVPTLELKDTLEFTILPGAAVAVRSLPADTSVLSGGTTTFVAAVVDRNGNTRDSDNITWTASPGASIAASSVASGPIGRHTFIAQFGELKDTSYLSVLPAYRVVGVKGFGMTPYPVIAMNLDGSDAQTFATITDGGIGARPAWIGTDAVVYSKLDGSLQHLFTSTSGSTSRFLAAPPATMSHEAEPAPTANGNWVYFSAWDTRCPFNDYCLFRATATGANPEMIYGASPTRQPSPSPDGSRVAFLAGGSGSSNGIKVLTIASGNQLLLSESGIHPRWSPDGTRIAFSNAGKVWLINPDGTGLTDVSPSGRTYGEQRVNWSPDSQWLIATSNQGPELIEVATKTFLLAPKMSVSQPHLR